MFPCMRRLLVFGVLIAAAAQPAGAELSRSHAERSLDDMVQRVQLSKVVVSPDGRAVAFAEIRARVVTNDYLISLYVQFANGANPARRLATYTLPSDGLFDSSHGLSKGA